MKRTLTVGCATCALDGAGAGTVEVKMEGAPGYIKCINPKETVQPGTTLELQFEFNPNDVEKPVFNLGEIYEGVGHWIEHTVIVVLTGGFVPESSQPAREFQVHVKVYSHHL